MNSYSASHHKTLLRYYLRRRRTREQSTLTSPAAAFQLQQAARPLVRDLASGATVAAFLPLPTEPPLTQLLEHLVQKKMRVVVPVVRGKRTLEWVEWSPTITTATNALGIDEPVGKNLGSEAFLQANLRLIPALAVDIHGRRLGQGGGFYDVLTQELSKDAKASTFAVVFDHEILDGLPAEPHDYRTSAALTPSGVRYFSF